jgi:hypothetical protein
VKRLVIGNIVWLPYLLILAVICLRLFVDHPYNFIPIFSGLLFFGACRPTRECALPVLVLVGVDAFLTTHQYGFALSAGHMVTWIWYLVAVTLGAAALGKSISVPRVLGSSLLASISFFVVSNFTVWAEWTMYPKTLAGLNACYAAALPFFRNNIVSETVFSLGIFLLARCSETMILNFRTRRVQV